MSTAHYDNYAPRRLHRTGIKFNPYVFVIGAGYVFADGRTRIADGNSQAAQPAQGVALATAVPGCQSCHSS